MAETATRRSIAARSPLRAWAILLVAGVSWGATYSLAKLATQDGAQPLGVALWQGLVGAALLGLVEMVRRRKLPLDRRHLLFYLVCGFLGTALPSTLYFYAAPHLPAGVLAITLGLTPLLTFLGAVLLKLDRYAPGRLLGVFFGIGAVLMIALPDASLPERTAAIWVVAALAAALSYTAENLIIAKFRPRSTQSLTLLLGMMTVATAALVPIVVVTGSFVPLAWPWGTVEWSILGMSAINVLSYWLFIYLVGVTGPIFATQMAYVVMVSGVLWGILIFAESHSGWIWGALGEMLAGLALVAPRRQDPGARAQESEAAE